MCSMPAHSCCVLGGLTCVGETESQSIMDPPGGPGSVFVTVPVRKEAWSVFSGRTPFGWGSAPLYWPLCGSLIEPSCQQAAWSQCRVHYVIQTHSGVPREVLGSADNSAAPHLTRRGALPLSVALAFHEWRKTPILLFKNPIIPGSSLENPIIPLYIFLWLEHHLYT